MKKRRFVVLSVVCILSVMMCGCRMIKKEKMTVNLTEKPEKMTEMSEDMTEVSESAGVAENGAVSEGMEQELSWEQSHGARIQEDENYRYVCCSSRIYKVHKETGETEILWESTGLTENPDMFDEGTALLVGDKLYFVEKQMTEDSYGEKLMLSVIGTDGAGYQRVVKDLDSATVSLYLHKQMLVLSTYDTEKYYEPEPDGGLVENRKTEEETLWGRLGEGYSHTAYQNMGTQYLSAVESMEKYGYVLAYNAENELCAVYEDGTETNLRDNGYIVAKNDRYFLLQNYVEEDWYLILLDNRSLKYKPLKKYDSSEYDVILGMDEEYIYYGKDVESEETADGFAIWRMAVTDGAAEELFTLSDGNPVENRYFKGWMTQFSKEKHCFYYVGTEDYQAYMMTRNMEAAEEEKLTPAFFDSGISKVGVVESYERSIYSETYPDMQLMDISLERLVVDERFAGAEKINQFLEENMKEDIAYAEESAQWQEDCIEEYVEDDLWFHCSYSSSVSDIWYFDGNYFSFVKEDYDNQGGAHGLPYHTGYTFDLNTGERLGLKDIVGNCEEELRDIVTKYFSAYINQNREVFWEDAISTVRESISYEADFYLKEDGIAFYFHPYALASYAEGFQEVTIPYEAFQMKLPIGK